MKLTKLFTLLFSLITITTIAQSRDTTYFIYQNLGPSVNTTYNESGPRISPDGSTLYFFRVDHPEDLKGSNDIWVSNLSGDSTWSVAKRLGEPLNNFNDNAVHSVSENNKKLLVHDIYLKNQTSKSGVSISKKQADGSWSFPKKLKIKKYQNTTELCSFHLSDDWQTLILAIETEETVGKQDLYVSFHDKLKDVWSEPKDLGRTINTIGAEATAFLAGDQKTLYFSSDGHSNTHGGFDIYKSTRLDDSWENWSTPENIGKPYNTPDDEFYFSIPAHAGGWAYLAHSHDHGHSDITRIKKVTESLPDPELIVFGMLYDNTTKKALNGNITFTITSIDSIIGIASADTIKEYNQILKGYKTYTYSIKKEGYQDFEGTLDLTELDINGKKRLDIYLIPIPKKEEEQLTLRGIEFETSKWDILPKFLPELEKAFVFLNKYQDYNYEIAGHTDSRDTDKRNQVLSQNRANAVKKYLIAKGIRAERLTSVGYGEKKPTDTNETEEGRQRNRRVELIKK